MSVPLNKISPRAGTPESQRRLEAWQEKIKQIDPRHWVFVDASGEATEMTRRYGRAPRGEWVREATPAGHWSPLTLLEEMSEEGLLATMIGESPTDGDVLGAYLGQVLRPQLLAQKLPTLNADVLKALARLLALPKTLTRKPEMIAELDLCATACILCLTVPVLYRCSG